MTGIINLITNRLNSINFESPLTYIDIFLAVFIIVATLLYLRRFPIFRVVLGILFLLFCSSLFFMSGLLFTALIFGIVSNLILISLPLIFAPEIRHYLEKIGRFSYLKIPNLTDKQKLASFVQNLVESAFELAELKQGALIVIQRRTGLGETIETGILIDAKLTPKLLQSIFYPKAPLHDGAVVVKDNRIIAAGCLLPIHSDLRVDKKFGTRHRSGLSITKDTDAVVIIVSEERGEVTLAENGKWFVGIDRVELTQKLLKLL